MTPGDKNPPLPRAGPNVLQREAGRDLGRPEEVAGLRLQVPAGPGVKAPHQE